MADSPFDVERAHRWFAVELNNLAWDALDAENRSPDDDELLVHAAHGACYHWLQVGTILNHQRAQCLLATVYTRLGYAEAALRHAVKCLELSGQTGESQDTFDLATAYGCAAGAYRCSNRHDEAADMEAKARQAAANFVDADDKAVFEQLYG